MRLCRNENRLFVESTIALVDRLDGSGKEDSVRDIVAGLTSARKYISSKFFYDAVGSSLFEEITRLPEYYLTRTEKSILKRIAVKIGSELKDVDIIELGSGDCSKISILLSSMPEGRVSSIRYIPVDVSHAAIEQSASVLADRYPGLTIQGVVADFTKTLKQVPSGRKRVVCFFGSTIGNLSRDQAVRFVANVGKIMNCGDMLLLGADMVKSKDVLEKAYNDAGGVTARFNKNILSVVNTIAKTNFNPSDFEHVSFYNEGMCRVEMHLRAVRHVEIRSPHLGERVIVKRGETIHTENSYKFTIEGIDRLASASGLEIENTFTDHNRWFSVVQFRKPGGPPV